MTCAPLALLEFGVAELWTGRFEAAERHLEQAHALAQRIERPFLALSALAHLAQIAIFHAVPLGAERSKQAIELARTVVVKRDATLDDSERGTR